MINNIDRKTFKDVSGIYKITNTVDGKVYVGRSKDLYVRCRQYFIAFRTRDKRKINDHLMRAMIKYGFDKFRFEVIELCDTKETPLKELNWMLIFKSLDRCFGYNIRKDLDGLMIVSKETSEKISARLKKEWSEGVRSDHCDKLKSSWVNRDRLKQSKIMSKALTKYKYQLIFPTGETIVTNFKCLKAFGYGNALSSFHRNKTDVTIVKRVKIKRISI